MVSYGEAFQVTQEYLAYHEEKSRQEARPQAALSAAAYQVKDLWLQGDKRGGLAVIPMGEDFGVRGEIYSPDDRAPTVAVGIMRINGTEIYGFTSDVDGVVLKRQEPHCFVFALTFPRLALLPGRYKLCAHAMDPEGMRLFDVMEREFQVLGRTREMGVCRLTHQWQESSL